MMEYVPMISYFLTNEMRLLCGLFLVARVMHFLPKRKLAAFRSQLCKWQDGRRWVF